MVSVMQINRIFQGLFLFSLLLPLLAIASNIDLATVPARSSVQLTIYNSEDLTLVRERRIVTFKPVSYTHLTLPTSDLV